jgi:hypothetical protein
LLVRHWLKKLIKKKKKKTKNEKGGGVLIILQIWEQSVISPNYGVKSLVSLKEVGVNVIYPYFYFP